MSTYECLMPYCRARVYQHGACCDDCWADRKGQLTSLPDLYVMTYAMLTPGSRQQEVGTIHVPALDPAAPINLVAYDALSHAYARLGAWAGWAATLAGQPRMQLTRYTTGKGFMTVVDILTRCDDRFALTSYAGTYALDVFTAYRRLVVQCVPAGPRHLDAPCPDCGAGTVITRHADEFAMCLTCANVWPHSQFPTLSRQGTAS